jgi:hypothetical protein
VCERYDTVEAVPNGEDGCKGGSRFNYYDERYGS